MPGKEIDKKPDEDENLVAQPSDVRAPGSRLGPILIGLIYGYLSLGAAISFAATGGGIPPDGSAVELLLAWLKIIAILYSVVVLLVYVLFAFRRRAVRTGALVGIVTPWLPAPLFVAFTGSLHAMFGFLMICLSFVIFPRVGEYISSLARRLRAWWF